MRGNLFLKIIPLILLFLGGLVYAQSRDPKPSPSQIKRTQSEALRLDRHASALKRIVKSLKEFVRDNDPKDIILGSILPSMSGEKGSYKRAQESHQKAEAALEKLEILAKDVGTHARIAYESVEEDKGYYIYAEGVVVDKGGTNQLHMAEESRKQAYSMLETFQREWNDTHAFTELALSGSKTSQDLGALAVEAGTAFAGPVVVLTEIVTTYAIQSFNSSEKATGKFLVGLGTFLAFRGLEKVVVKDNKNLAEGVKKYLEKFFSVGESGTKSAVEKAVEEIEKKIENTESEVGSKNDLKGWVADAPVPGQGVPDAKSSSPGSETSSIGDDTFSPDNVSSAPREARETSDRLRSETQAIYDQFSPANVAPGVGGWGPSYYGGGPGSQAPGRSGSGWVRIGPTRPGQNIGGEWWFEFKETTWYWRPSRRDYDVSIIPRPVNDCLHKIGEADRRRTDGKQNQLQEEKDE
ncbi:MAG: hypothetical protein QMD05_10035 [Candidatus Brocadiaceae bacterium]|nr:hypothetical protein [Candidatus Brocadiaceae bacterium]